MDSILEYDAFASPGSNVSDDEDAWSGDDADCVCVECNGVFQLSAKGCSLFRRLCTSCHAEHKRKINEDAVSSEDEDFVTTPLVAGDNVVNTDSISGSSDQTTVIRAAQETSKYGEMVINNGNQASSTDINIEQNEEKMNEDTAMVEDEGKEEKRLCRGDSGQVWSEEIMSAFLSKDISFQLDIAGFSQCFVMKKYKMDPPGTVLRFYADLELVDRCKPLYHYIVLSAHFNSSKKSLVLARSIVVHNKTHAKYVVLAIFRTKCIKPRYDPILMDVTTLTVFRLTGMANFRKDYTYTPDEPVDNKLTADRLVEWVIENGLVHDANIRPNKNEDGSTHGDDSWKSGYAENIFDSSLQRRSQRAPQPVLRDDPPAVQTSKRKGSKKKGAQSETEHEPKKKTRRGNKNKKKERCCQEVSTKDVDDFASVVVEIEDDADEPDEATENAVLKTQIKQLESQLKERKVMKDKIFKLKLQLQALDNIESDETEDDKPLPNQASQRNESSSSLLDMPAPFKRNAAQMEGNPSPPIMRKRSSRGLNYAQMMVVQNQATRIADSHHRLRDAELQNVFYENMIMNGVNFKF